MKTKVFLRKCLGSRYVNYRIIALIDLLLSVIASLSAVFIASYALLTLTGIYFHEAVAEYTGIDHPTLSFIVLSGGFSLLILLLFPVYKGIIRIRTFSYGFNYLWLSLCKALFLGLTLGVLSREWLFGVVYFALDTLFTLFFLTGFRTVVQFIWSFVNGAPSTMSRTPALIFGVDDRSAQLADKLSNSYQGKGLYVVGFVETNRKDDRRRQTTLLHARHRRLLCTTGQAPYLRPPLLWLRCAARECPLCINLHRPQDSSPR